KDGSLGAAARARSQPVRAVCRRESVGCGQAPRAAAMGVVADKRHAALAPHAVEMLVGRRVRVLVGGFAKRARGGAPRLSGAKERGWGLRPSERSRRRG